MDARARVVFRGHVQGVYFRANCQVKAMELGLVGFVRNRRDGTVEAVFEGKPNAVEGLVRWCEHGPRGAAVARVEVFDEPPERLSAFSIR